MPKALNKLELLGADLAAALLEPNKFPPLCEPGALPDKDEDGCPPVTPKLNSGFAVWFEVLDSAGLFSAGLAPNAVDPNTVAGLDEELAVANGFGAALGTPNTDAPEGFERLLLEVNVAGALNPKADGSGAVLGVVESLVTGLLLSLVPPSGVNGVNATVEGPFMTESKGLPEGAAGPVAALVEEVFEGPVSPKLNFSGPEAGFVAGLEAAGAVVG